MNVNSIDRNLAFRQAAATGNTQQMINLIKTGMIDINSAGSKTQQTAMHRAAAGGHLAAVHLLFNLGALTDKIDGNRKTPLELAENQEVKQAFQLIDIAKQALDVREKWFPENSQEIEKKENSNVLDIIKHTKE